MPQTASVSYPRGVLAVPLFVAAVLLAISPACSRKTSVAAPPPPLEVKVAQVQQKDVPVYGSWIGTLDGLVNADIKAEVSGYLISQDYKEGSFVKRGQLLFQIDPRPFQAALDLAQGQLAQSQGLAEQSRAQLGQSEAQVAVAQANQRRTQLDVDRFTPLAEQQAITQQDLDNATQNNMAAKATVQSATAQVATTRAQIVAAEAAVQSAKASVDAARINLGFTRIVSPIDGIPGIAQLQVGALVSPASGAITTVSTLNPIKAYFTVSEQEFLDFTRRFPTAEQRQTDLQRLQFELILADGSRYRYPGKFDFANRQVEVRTGAIRVAALFPNPENNLRPGQFGRVRVARSILQGALLVPQRAVIDLQGTRQLAVVDSSNKISIRTITVGDTVGPLWIISSGIRPGERVVVEGIQKVRDGMLVNPKPFETK